MITASRIETNASMEISLGKRFNVLPAGKIFLQLLLRIFVLISAYLILAAKKDLILKTPHIVVCLAIYLAKHVLGLWLLNALVAAPISFCIIIIAWGNALLGYLFTTLAACLLA